MLTLTIAAVGTLKEPYFRDAFDEYRRRAGAYCKLRVAEVPEARLPSKPSPAQIEAAVKKEGAALLPHLAGGRTVALCVGGTHMTSRGLADYLAQAALASARPVFVIGGPCGLSPEVEAGAHLALSLSDMTLPHRLCRVVLMEQLYRALSINAGSPYHR